MQWIEQNLGWVAAIAVLLALLGALRWDLLGLLGRELMNIGTPHPPGQIDPPPEHGHAPAQRLHGPHDVPVQKPAFHRSGRRQGER